MGVQVPLSAPFSITYRADQAGSYLGTRSFLGIHNATEPATVTTSYLAATPTRPFRQDADRSALRRPLGHGLAAVDVYISRSHSKAHPGWLKFRLGQSDRIHGCVVHFCRVSTPKLPPKVGAPWSGTAEASGAGTYAGFARHTPRNHWFGTEMSSHATSAACDAPSSITMARTRCDRERLLNPCLRWA